MKALGLTALATAFLLMTAQAHAGRAVQHSGQAIHQSANAAGYSMIGATQLVFGVVSVPLKLMGALSGASGEMGDSLWEAANAPIGEPLPIADESITAGPPPAEALLGAQRKP